jgi:hypothetical protein
VWKLTSSVGGRHPHLGLPVAKASCLRLRMMYCSTLRGLDSWRMPAVADVIARDAGRFTTTSIALRCAVLCCAVLCCAVLCCTGPDCTVLYCTASSLSSNITTIVLAPNCDCTWCLVQVWLLGCVLHVRDLVWCDCPGLSRLHSSE